MHKHLTIAKHKPCIVKFPNILLADDECDSKFLIESFHSISPDYKISKVNNGIECVAFLKQNELPDLVFLDLNMPIKNGIDTLKYLKSTDNFAHIPVIIYSTSHYIKDIDAAFKNGAHFYIVKPLDTSILSEMILNIIDSISANGDRPGKDKFVVRAKVNYVS